MKMKIIITFFCIMLCVPLLITPALAYPVSTTSIQQPQHTMVHTANTPVIHPSQTTTQIPAHINTPAVYAPLKLVSSVETVHTSVLTSYQATNTVISFTNVTYYLLNFSYTNTYVVSPQQKGNLFGIDYNVNETLTFYAYMFFPVILAIYRNNTASAGSPNYIYTQSFTDPIYNAGIGFGVNLGLQYYFSANLFGFNPHIGPGSNIIPVFNPHWNFTTPLDGQFSLGKISLPGSLSIVTDILSLGLSVEPTIDTTFSADLQSSNSGVLLSTNHLSWGQNNDIQAFSAIYPEFYSQANSLINLFNFDMQAHLNLQLDLDLTVSLPIIFSHTFSFPIFSFPIAQADLGLVGNIPVNTAITPSQALPYVYGVNYGYTDLNHTNNVIHPGDTVGLAFAIANLGNGSALNVNTTLSSSNATVTNYKTTTPVLLRNIGPYVELTGFQFKIPSNYASRLAVVTATFIYLSTNGTVKSSTYDMLFRVYLPNDLYLQISNIFANTTQWIAGTGIAFSFNVTNLGNQALQYANLTFYTGVDTDGTYSVNVANLGTNATTSLNTGQSTILGYLNLSSVVQHNDGLVYIYMAVFYSNSTTLYEDIIYFAVPIYHPKPAFTFVSAIGSGPSITLGNGTTLYKAGGQVSITFTVSNTGTGSASSISGQITTSNADLNITQSRITLPDLAPNTQSGSTQAVVNIPITAKNQTAYFTLHLTGTDDKGNIVAQDFNISIHILAAPLPKITLLSYTIDDSVYGNGNNIAEPGEIFVLYVNIHLNNTGFNVLGILNTTKALNVYNATSNYGTLTNSTASGAGFIVGVPLNYPGGVSRLNVTLYAHSYAGDEVNVTGYILLNIVAGDLTPPLMSTLNVTIPTQLLSGQTINVGLSVTDPTVPLQIVSGVSKVVLITSFNNGPIQVITLSSTNGLNYGFTITSQQTGTLQFIVASIDNAGNIAYIANGNQAFTITIQQQTTTTTNPITTPATTPPVSSTPPTSSVPKSSFGTLSIVLLAIFVLPAITLYRRKK